MLSNKSDRANPGKIFFSMINYRKTSRYFPACSHLNSEERGVSRRSLFDSRAEWSY